MAEMPDQPAAGNGDDLVESAGLFGRGIVAHPGLKVAKHIGQRVVAMERNDVGKAKTLTIVPVGAVEASEIRRRQAIQAKASLLAS